MDKSQNQVIPLYSNVYALDVSPFLIYVQNIYWPVVSLFSIPYSYFNNFAHFTSLSDWSRQILFFSPWVLFVIYFGSSIEAVLIDFETKIPENKFNGEETVCLCVIAKNLVFAQPFCQNVREICHINYNKAYQTSGKVFRIKLIFASTVWSQMLLLLLESNWVNCQKCDGHINNKKRIQIGWLSCCFEHVTLMFLCLGIRTNRRILIDSNSFKHPINNWVEGEQEKKKQTNKNQ